MRKVYGVSMFRDEADVAAHVLRHLVEEGLDGVIIADNRSQDGTGRRLKVEKAALEREFPGVDILLFRDNEVGYYQSRKMTNLARLAAERGADWIVPFDADEIWFSRQDRIGNVLRGLPKTVMAVRAPLWNQFPSSIDPAGDNPFKTIQWRQRDPGTLPKVAVRYRDDLVIHQGNHGFTYGGLPETQVRNDVLELRHFPYRSFEQFKRKVKNGAEAYAAATDLAPDQGAHWRSYGQILEVHGEEALREVYTTWFWHLSPVDAGLILDPAPFRRWQ